MTKDSQRTVNRWAHVMAGERLLEVKVDEYVGIWDGPLTHHHAKLAAIPIDRAARWEKKKEL
jgi:hypothetical protein